MNANRIMIAWFIFLACIAASHRCSAEPFIDLGVGYAIQPDASMGKSCIRDYEDQRWGCSENPLGYAAVGWQHEQVSVQIEHWSSVTDYDAGLDIISVKYRIGGKQ